MIRMFFIVLLMFSSSSKAGKKDLKEFSIGLSVLPKDAKFRNNQIQYFFYIFRQAYAPMFSYNEDKDELTSFYFDLEKTELKSSKKEYHFYLKKGLKFNNGDLVMVKDVQETFNYLAKEQTSLSIKRVEKHKDFVSVILKKENPYFLEKLNYIFTAIIKFDTANHDIPIGLGPYTIKSFKKEMIALEARKDLLKGNVKKIVFKLVNTPEKGQVAEVDDFNLLRPNLRKKIPKEDFNYIMGSSGKVGFLYLKIKNKKVREQIMASMNRGKFIDATKYYKAKKLPGLFKKYVPGWNQEMTRPKAKVIKGSYSYDYIDSGRLDKKKLQAYFDSLMPSNIKINVRVIKDSREDLKTWQSNREQLGIIAGGVWKHDIYSFYRGVFKDKSLNSLVLPLENRDVLKGKFETAISTHEKVKREDLFKDLHKTILDEYFFYPMGYFERKYWYPKKVKNYELFKQHNGMPMLDSLILE